MNYCSNCGAPVSHRTPPGDDRPRYVCDMCAAIHYLNPKIVAGCVPQWDDRVLLCRRAIEPRRGYWTLPAGFLENGETPEEGAARETWEEAQCQIDAGPLYTLFSLPHISQVYMFFRAELGDATFGPGMETLECGLFTQADIPWEELAFPVVGKTLTHFYNDRVQGEFPVRTEAIRFKRR